MSLGVRLLLPVNPALRAGAEGIPMGQKQGLVRDYHMGPSLSGVLLRASAKLSVYRQTIGHVPNKINVDFNKKQYFQNLSLKVKPCVTA